MGIYTNFFNETPEEQERRRQMLYQKYDDAVQKSQYSDDDINNPEKFDSIKRSWTVKDAQNPAMQIGQAIKDMSDEYDLMKSHNYKNLDDYYHCKANYNAASHGIFGNVTANVLGTGKEVFDLLRNVLYKKMPVEAAQKDMQNDLTVNRIGRDRARSCLGISAQDACSDYRDKNQSLPRKYW